MNGGVEILLARMKTHPEEFFTMSSRWSNMIADYQRYLDEKDFKALEEGIKKCRQEEFTQNVMQKLLNEEREDQEAFKLTSNGAFGAFDGTGASWTNILPNGATVTLTHPPKKIK